MSFPPASAQRVPADSAWGARTTTARSVPCLGRWERKRGSGNREGLRLTRFQNTSAGPRKKPTHPSRPSSPNSFLTPLASPLPLSPPTLTSLAHPHSHIPTSLQPGSLKITDLPAKHLTPPTPCHSLPATKAKLNFASFAGTFGGGIDHDVQWGSAVVTRDFWDRSSKRSLCSGVTRCEHHCSCLCLDCSAYPSKSIMPGRG